MIVRKTAEKGIRITKIEGANLPLETEKNVAGVALLAMLEEVDADFGFEIEIYKHIKAGSGIGSSATNGRSWLINNKLILRCSVCSTINSSI